jgi:hypothetical protein
VTIPENFRAHQSRPIVAVPYFPDRKKLSALVPDYFSFEKVCSLIVTKDPKSEIKLLKDKKGDSLGRIEVWVAKDSLKQFIDQRIPLEGEDFLLLEFAPPRMICFHCQLLHTGPCLHPAPVCGKCSGSHDVKDCHSATFLCPFCKSTSHAVFQCPARRRRLHEMTAVAIDELRVKNGFQPKHQKQPVPPLGSLQVFPPPPPPPLRVPLLPPPPPHPMPAAGAPLGGQGPQPAMFTPQDRQLLASALEQLHSVTEQLSSVVRRLNTAEEQLAIAQKQNAEFKNTIADLRAQIAVQLPSERHDPLPSPPAPVPAASPAPAPPSAPPPASSAPAAEGKQEKTGKKQRRKRRHDASNPTSSPTSSPISSPRAKQARNQNEDDEDSEELEEKKNNVQ